MSRHPNSNDNTRCQDNKNRSLKKFFFCHDQNDYQTQIYYFKIKMLQK